MQENNSGSRRDDHALALANRNHLRVQGVAQVDSSAGEEICLQTSLGEMRILGEDLHILNLDLEEGEVTVAGKIDTLHYPAAPLRHKAKSRGGGVVRRLLK